MHQRFPQPAKDSDDDLQPPQKKHATTLGDAISVLSEKKYDFLRRQIEQQGKLHEQELVIERERLQLEAAKANFRQCVMGVPGIQKEGQEGQEEVQVTCHSTPTYMTTTNFANYLTSHLPDTHDTLSPYLISSSIHVISHNTMMSNLAWTSTAPSQRHSALNEERSENSNPQSTKTVNQSTNQLANQSID
ncbi:hypothetical protein L873DRAFT_1845817 [Choiromyces venosus 120613-1]|uniref:Uncharacterized protein n=1 Tax=Choiromyces venosus 120613-1 TaxID=1336337 RepID=A0A3N4JG74_9PEZI|nr:hypothetical protein L873DRAFT_1845817 [Choiromyces venosus 120613-1]